MTHDRQMNVNVHSGEQELTHEREMKSRFGEQEITHDRMRS